MSDSILVGYATRYGSTHEVAEAVAATLRESGAEGAGLYIMTGRSSSTILKPILIHVLGERY